MEEITKKLFELQDKNYSAFHGKLVPNIDTSSIIGVRVPLIKTLAKQIYNSGQYKEFLSELPHKYYDENMLHSTIITLMKDYDECIKALYDFLPYIDNWAVCDVSPKSFKKHHDDLINHIKIWCSSSHTYTCRFGIHALMSEYLDDDFSDEYLKIPLSIVSDEYYVNMMIAWYFATALAKQWDATIPIIESKSLSVWVHNKTIQKSVESYRITDAQKAYLKTLKR